MEKIFTKENALRIINETKKKKIDIRKTIEKSQSAGSFGLMHTYCMPLEYDDRTRKTFPELMGMKFNDYDNYVDEAYYERVMSHLEEGNGIYITLAYVNEASPNKDDRIMNIKHPDSIMKWKRKYMTIMKVMRITLTILVSFQQMKLFS